VRPQVVFFRHRLSPDRHRSSPDRRTRAGAESRRRQVRRATFRGQLRGLPSQRARTGQGPVKLDAVVVSAAALHEQPRISAGAHCLSAVRRCRASQRAVRRRQIARLGRERIGAGAEPIGSMAASPGGNTAALGEADLNRYQARACEAAARSSAIWLAGLRPYRTAVGPFEPIYEGIDWRERRPYPARQWPSRPPRNRRDRADRFRHVTHNFPQQSPRWAINSRNSLRSGWGIPRNSIQYRHSCSRIG
jgi:hypothetical protein